MNSVESIQAKLALDVAVIGGGICGLSIAFACAEVGMKVTVYEAVSKKTEVGAGIQVAPNMSRILRRWNLFDALLPQATLLDGVSIRRYANDIELDRVHLNNIAAVHGAPNMLVHRADLHSVLRMGAEKVGAKIYTGCVVEDIDFENTSLKIKDNPNWIQADVILAADGNRSQIRNKILEIRSEGDNVRNIGDAAWRVIVSAEQVYASQDIGLIEILEGSTAVRWIGPKAHIFCYPIRNHELINAICVHTDRQIGTEESWTKTGDKRELEAFYAGWNSRVQALLNCTLQENVLESKLCDHTPLTTWVHGKVALSGDAAHTVLPYVAQGAAQAVEDAAVLGICLAMIDSKTQINTALKVYELVRKERAELIQASGARNCRLLHLHDGKEQEDRDKMFCNTAKGGRHPDIWCDKAFQKWTWSMDTQQQTLEKWDELVKLVTSGQSFESPFTTKNETWINKHKA